MIQKFNTGEIWLADLSPRVGTELGKIRPALIIQNQALLDAEHPSTLIIPLTTNVVENAEPLRINITAFELLERNSDLLIDQIRAIDNKRLTEGPLVRCGQSFMAKVYKAIFEVLGCRVEDLF